MELGGGGGEATAGSHWEMRNAKDELMAGIPGVGYYTALTMAVFEDMGFYRANWSMAEAMNWGRNAGCRLLAEKCITNGTSECPDMFCTRSVVEEPVKLCTSSRLSLGSCFFETHDNALPTQYQYFYVPNRGGLTEYLTDYCPVVQPFLDNDCFNGLQGRMPGSRLGPKSKCLKGHNLEYNKMRVGDVCAEVECGNDGTLRVRYFGDDTWNACPEGSQITPKRNFTGGTIVCPKYSEVCLETGRDTTEVDLNRMEPDINKTCAHSIQ